MDLIVTNEENVFRVKNKRCCFCCTLKNRKEITVNGKNGSEKSEYAYVVEKLIVKKIPVKKTVKKCLKITEKGDETSKKIEEKSKENCQENKEIKEKSKIITEKLTKVVQRKINNELDEKSEKVDNSVTHKTGSRENSNILFTSYRQMNPKQFFPEDQQPKSLKAENKVDENPQKHSLSHRKEYFTRKPWNLAPVHSPRQEQDTFFSLHQRNNVDYWNEIDPFLKETLKLLSDEKTDNDFFEGRGKSLSSIGKEDNLEANGEALKLSSDVYQSSNCSYEIPTKLSKSRRNLYKGDVCESPVQRKMLGGVHGLGLESRPKSKEVKWKIIISQKKGSRN